MNNNIGSDNGFYRVGAFSPKLKIGNPMENAKSILDTITTNKKLSVCDIIVTPELSLTGYTCQDLFFNQELLNKCTKAIHYLTDNVRSDQILIVGAPVNIKGELFNCAVVITKYDVIARIPKTYIPNYSEFYEKRWFKSGLDIKDKIKSYEAVSNTPFGQNIISTDNLRFGVEICEDLWAPEPPSNKLALNGAEIIFNCSASNETIGKADFRRNLVKMQSAKLISAYVYCSSGIYESTSDTVFGGHNIIAENGAILAELELFDIDGLGVVTADIDVGRINHDRMVNKTFDVSRSYDTDIIVKRVKFKQRNELDRKVSITPFVPGEKHLSKRCKDIYDIQVAGLASRWLSTKIKKLVIGVSGGLDSTLALLVAVGAANKLGKSHKDILGITMPCFGTTDQTLSNSFNLMESLGCSVKCIDIGNSVKSHLADIGLSEDDRSIAFENAQARERTQVLMDIANNENGFVVGTGDLSELALGWCTYNGDHMSMYSVNSSIPKTLVRTLVYNIGEQIESDMEQGLYGYDPDDARDFRHTIQDIIATPISPELLPPDQQGNIAQLTEDTIGPYLLNDFFLYYTLRFGFSPYKIYTLLKESLKQNNIKQYTTDDIKKWMKNFYNRFSRAQFKRNCCPDGVKVGSVSFSPRADWRCPTEMDLSYFITEVDNIQD
jgi:NAD+ synthase (glutamine-hydrolysing)